MSAIEEFLTLPAEEQEEKIKRLLHETIHEGDPAVKEAAYEMGLSPFTLYKWGSTESEKVPRLRQLIHLLHLKKNLKILDFLNNLFGLLTFPKPQSLESLEEISRHITRVFKEASAACQAIIDSVEPDSRGGMEITWDEFREIQQEIKSAQQQLAGLEEAARKKAQKHPSWPLRLTGRLSRSR
jgi:hypothetical protein